MWVLAVSRSKGWYAEVGSRGDGVQMVERGFPTTGKAS